MVSEEDRPAWMGGLEKSLSRFLRNPTEVTRAGELVKALVQFFPLISAQVWAVKDHMVSTPVDFDEVYRRYYEESRLPQLFEEMIRKLQDIVDCGEIDSVRALRSLEKTIATIRRNLHGSFYSTFQTVRFIRALFRNTVWEVASEFPIAGGMIRGLKATIDEMEEEWVEVQGKMQADLKAQTTLDLPAIEVRAETPRGLPSPTTDDSTKSE